MHVHSTIKSINKCVYTHMYVCISISLLTNEHVSLSIYMGIYVAMHEGLLELHAMQYTKKLDFVKKQ